jgi:3-oxoacyl-[acyl-carrier protein] reductase
MSRVADLTGQRVLVTGASSGIGAGMAEEFARRGAAVGICARRKDRLEEVLARCRAHSPTSRMWVTDMTDAGAVGSLAASALEELGGVDILVNNAGISMIARSDELDPAEWERAIATNLSGPYFCSRAAYPSMKERGGGVIVNLGSAAAHVGLPLRVAYCAAKHGMSGLTKVLALDWAADGIRILQIDPAYIKTPLDDRDQATGGYDDAAVERRTPMGRFGTLAEVAKMVLVAAGPDSSYMTGSSILIDGGWVAYGYL